jgi:ribosomal protein S18 acetylase RimI-like enzyme
MTDITISPAEYSTCSGISDVEGHADEADAFLQDLISRNRLIFVGTFKGIPAGQVALVFEKNDSDYTRPHTHIYLSRLIVKYSYRRQGIGSVIVDYLLQHAESLGYKEFSIGVDIDNVPARRLYEQKGFNETIFRGFDDGGEYVKLLRRIR